MWKAAVGLNLSRPIIVAFYAAVYLVPLRFRDVLFEGFSTPSRTPHCCSGGVGIAYFSSLFLQPGPLNSLIRFASRLPHGGTVLFALAAGRRTLQRRGRGFPALGSASSALILPSRHFLLVCSLLFYCAANRRGWKSSFITDRYVLQLAPFLGVVAFSVLPRLPHCAFSHLRSFHSQSRHALALWRSAAKATLPK